MERHLRAIASRLERRLGGSRQNRIGGNQELGRTMDIIIRSLGGIGCSYQRFSWQSTDLVSDAFGCNPAHGSERWLRRSVASVSRSTEPLSCILGWLCCLFRFCGDFAVPRSHGKCCFCAPRRSILRRMPRCYALHSKWRFWSRGGVTSATQHESEAISLCVYLYMCILIVYFAARGVTPPTL